MKQRRRILRPLYPHFMCAQTFSQIHSVLCSDVADHPRCGAAIATLFLKSAIGRQDTQKQRQFVGKGLESSCGGKNQSIPIIIDHRP